MRLKVKILKFLAGKPVCMIHTKTAEEIGLQINDRISINKKGHKPLISIIDTASGIINSNEIAVSDEVVKRLKLKKGNIVDIEIAPSPPTINLIKKKLKGKVLTKKEIQEIVKDIAKNALTEIEIAFFISSVYNSGMSLNETKNFINAMVKNSNVLKLRGKVVDKHSIGGVAGNRTTPIVVAICAEAGLKIPKTSSRAITSAAGTADVIETLAKVDFNIKEIKIIIKKTNAFFVWGGGLGLVPVDSKIIKVEKMVHIDSPAQMLASILSKKIAVDSNYILIDIPYGKSSKVSKKQAEKLKLKFLKLGKSFGLKIKVVLTNGKEPIGDGIGPNLEMIDVLRVLKRDNPPKDLEEKSIMLSGELLELSGKVRKGQGKKLALEILNSGKAFKKFEEIIKAQNGKIKKLKPGKFKHIVYAKKSTKIKHLDNKLINLLARFSGCPEDKTAGIYLYNKAGDKIKKSDKIMTIYSQSKDKLDNAVKFYNKNKKQMINVS